MMDAAASSGNRMVERAKVHQKRSLNYANALAAFDGSILLLVAGNLVESLILFDTAVELLLRAHIEAEGRFRRPPTLAPSSPRQRMQIVRREAPPTRQNAGWPDFNDLLSGFARWAPRIARRWAHPLAQLHRERNDLQHAGADSVNSPTETRFVQHVLDAGVPFFEDLFADEGIDLSACCGNWYRELGVARRVSQYGRKAILTLAFAMQYGFQFAEDDLVISHRDDVIESRRDEYKQILRQKMPAYELADLSCRIRGGTGVAAIDLGTCSAVTGETMEPPTVRGFCCPECRFALLADEPPGILDAHLQMTEEEWNEIMKDTR
jgi:hypothetical protein